jgi:hypothetical protein
MTVLEQTVAPNCYNCCGSDSRVWSGFRSSERNKIVAHVCFLPDLMKGGLL